MKLYKLCAGLMIAGVCSIGVAQSAAGSGTAASGTATAAKPSREDVLRLFDAMHLRKQMETMMTAMAGQVSQQMKLTMQKSGHSSAAEQSKMESSMNEVMTLYPIPEMMDDMVPVYQRHMSKGDISAIIAFYGSEAGQHLLAESQVMMQESMAVVMPKMNTRMQAYMEKMSKEMQGPAPSSPTSTPAPK